MDKATFNKRVEELAERLKVVQKAIRESGMSSQAQMQGEVTAMDLLVLAYLTSEPKE